MNRFKKKRKLDEGVKYVLTDGNLPGVYDFYEDALKHSYPWDMDGKKIKAFKTRGEAEYFHLLGVEIGTNQASLFSEEENKNCAKHPVTRDEDPYADL